MPPQHQKPRLYALLVAINKYASPVPPLQGCVNDLEKITAYLQKEDDHFDIKIKKLVNEEATKEAIVTQFRKHLGQASSEDVAFFYFSGHGTQEEADPVFWPIEEDHKHEALVCFDSYTIEQGQAKLRLLADKELRYLIHEISRQGSHVLTIFDCCHSGGNTRNAYISEQAEEVRERRFINRARLSQAFPMRDWQDFIFSEAISYEDAQKQSLVQLLPEGKHIQMAACQNDQSAFEVKGEGVFTKNLLEVLTRCEGAVTYYDLQSRIQNYLKKQFDQTPRVYIVGDEESALFQGFLNQKVEGKPLYGNINYNPDLGWIMDLGAMHGVSLQSPTVKVRTLEDQREFTAKLKEVYPGYAQLIFDQAEEKQLNRNISYKGFIVDYFSFPIGVYLSVQEESIRQSLLTLISSVSPNVYVVSAAYEADYWVQFTDHQFFITRPGTPKIPIVQPRKYNSDSDLHIIGHYLNHLSQFEFVKNLHNPNTFLFHRDPVTLTVFKRNPMGEEEEVPVHNGELLLTYEQQPNQKWGGSIRMVLKNHTDRKLYCALLYLSFNFGITVKLLKEVVVGLSPNQEVWTLDGAPIGLTLEEEVLRYNYPESNSYLKLIVSTSDFKQQVTRFEMPPLPRPLASGTRGLELDVNVYHPADIEDWTTRLITLRIKNPVYNSV